MVPHSSTLAWKIPWTEKPGRLQSMGSQRVRHDWATSLSLFTFAFHFHALEKKNGNPLQCSCLENPRDSGPPSMGSHRVGHEWSDAAAAADVVVRGCEVWNYSTHFCCHGGSCTQIREQPGELWGDGVGATRLNRLWHFLPQFPVTHLIHFLSLKESV